MIKNVSFYLNMNVENVCGETYSMKCLILMSSDSKTFSGILHNWIIRTDDYRVDLYAIKLIPFIIILKKCLAVKKCVVGSP